jgi:4-hydroxy-3-polyprenylbenzoate decarboxylase
MPTPLPFPDLASFLRALERAGELRRVTVPVDPYLEVSEITQRVTRRGGPALLFENVRGADFPLATNIYSSARRVELAIGEDPRAIGERLIGLYERLNPPSLSALWKARGELLRFRHATPSVVTRRKARAQEVIEPPRLTRMPHLTGWPRDGGPFITWGPTLTQDPRNGRRNFGLYRVQIYDDQTTGMHWQSMKGGRGHHFEAERLGQPLDTAIVLGGDPLVMLAAILPLPEGMDELALVGAIRGSPTPMVRASSVNLLVPANAEFVIEGRVAAHERRMEGPFGDHYGHYSEAAEFPVFHATAVTRSRTAIYPGTVVGKPPQEDKWLGIASGELVGPLIRAILPAVRDLYAFDAASFHNLLGVAQTERHPKESLKTALALLGTGQLSLTKVALMVRETVNPRDFRALLRELWHRFEPRERMLLLPITPLDTLDYTSYEMHVGSKVIWDACGEIVQPEPPPREVPHLREFDARIVDYALWEGFLLVTVRQQPREVLDRLIRWDGLGTIRFVAAVSDDVDLRDETSVLWGVFNRFDPARDFIVESQSFVGAKPVYDGRIGIDATWKEGYPLPVTMPDEVVRRVDSRWGEYGLD